MGEKLSKAALMLVALLVLLGPVWSQDSPQNLTLAVVGQPGQIPIVQINGKSYVSIDALARLTNSSLSTKGNQVMLTPAGSAPSTPTAPDSSAPAGQLKLVAAQGQPTEPESSDTPGQTKLAATDEKTAAPTEEAQAEALQKATQNPVASLISVPLQNNSNFSIGRYDRTQNVLNVQPVIPVHITENWNLITRIIQPIVWQPYPSQPTGGEFAFGDMNPSFFLSPFKPGKLIWGAGPTFVTTSATRFACSEPSPISISQLLY